jgi:hypothetical protein
MKRRKVKGERPLLVGRGSRTADARRGAAFDCCWAHRMIARKILALSKVGQQAVPETSPRVN